MVQALGGVGEYFGGGIMICFSRCTFAGALAPGPNWVLSIRPTHVLSSSSKTFPVPDTGRSSRRS
jgi:hypothetical protein